MKKVKSIGLIETLGIVGAVEAADTALKAANVECLGYELNRAGYVTIKLSGDVAAVQAAVSSGAATAARLGNLVATHVIARPDEQVVDVFVHSADNVPSPTDPDKSSDDPGDKKSEPVKTVAVPAKTQAKKKPAPRKTVPKSDSAKPVATKPVATKPVETKPVATKKVSPSEPTSPSDSSSSEKKK